MFLKITMIDRWNRFSEDRIHENSRHFFFTGNDSIFFPWIFKEFGVFGLSFFFRIASTYRFFKFASFAIFCSSNWLFLNLLITRYFFYFSLVSIFPNPLKMGRRISKGATLGTYLQGAATFCKDEIGKKVDCHTFKYVLCEPGKKSNSNAKNDKEKVSKWDEYKETLRDVKCTWLAKLGESRQKSDNFFSKTLFFETFYLKMNEFCDYRNYGTSK